MTGQTHTLPEGAAPWVGDPHPLLLRIGSARAREVVSPAGLAWPNGAMKSPSALRSFLESYRVELLLPVEFPSILRAYSHARRNELRELIALDRELSRDAQVRPFAAASCRVGQRQLNRLRPLRDQRLIQRYRAAIERGEAHGWHTLVYGLTLAVFGLPLRQGLFSYASHTLNGFITSAAGELALTPAQRSELETAAASPLPAAVQHLLTATGAACLRVL